MRLGLSSGRLWPRLTIILAVMTMVSACAVGPDFKRPAAPQARSYAPAPFPRRTASAPGPAGAAQDFSTSRNIPSAWWRLFRSPALDALVKKALAANPTVEDAQAVLRQAQEEVYAQQGYFFPTIQASYTPSHIMLSGNNAAADAPGMQGNGVSLTPYQGTPAIQGGKPPYNHPLTYNWHSAQLTVGFVPDVFGANRRQVESLQARAEARRFELEATDITLASNVATAAIQEAAVRAEIDAVRSIIAYREKSLAMLKLRHRYGYASQLAVDAHETALAESRLLLPPLEKQREQTRDLLRVLVGDAPDHDLPDTFDLASLHLPKHLPLSLPSRLVEQRPDVRAAQAMLHAATAEVGVAEADMLPQFSIDAVGGGQATEFSQMFWGSGKFLSIIGNVTQPLFAGGTLLHQKRAADQAMIQAQALYRRTVLAAFQNVADTLHALYADAESMQMAAQAKQAAGTMLTIARTQRKQGYTDALNLIGAEQAYQQASIALVQAQANRFGDTVALFQALGGGWWNRPAERTGAPASD